MKEGVLRIPIEVGVAVRGSIKRSIKSYLFSRNLDWDMKEDKGWIESTLYYTIRGPEDKLVQAKKDIDRWFRELNHT